MHSNHHEFSIILPLAHALCLPGDAGVALQEGGEQLHIARSGISKKGKVNFPGEAWIERGK